MKEETTDEIFQGLSFSFFFLTITQITSYFFTVSRREDYVVFVQLFFQAGFGSAAKLGNELLAQP